jgi:hypothetical protein
MNINSVKEPIFDSLVENDLFYTAMNHNFMNDNTTIDNTGTINNNQYKSGNDDDINEDDNNENDINEIFLDDNNTNGDTTINDNDDEEESEDEEGEVIDLDNWRYKYNNFTTVLCNEDEIDEKLLEIFTEEIRHINNVVKQQTKSSTMSLNNIISLFVSPLIPVIISAVNAAAATNEETIGINEAINFIRCLIALSYYRVTQSVLFEKSHVFPLASTLNEDDFKKVMNGLKSKPQSMNDDSEIMWDRPFMEDQSIRKGEEAIVKINREFFLPNKSILSTDDDHLRLSAIDCENIGLPRKNNPKKAFGPVATCVVSLTSGISLASRIAGRGENDVQTIRILCRNLFNKELPEQVDASNMFAMDRGYLSIDMIDYITSIGCSILGTHKRVKNYPFNFGKGVSQSTNKKKDKRVVIEEVGAKMTYWAQKVHSGSGRTYKALAYRSGRGHVATLFTSDATIGEEKFIYKPKKMHCSL